MEIVAVSNDEIGLAGLVDAIREAAPEANVAGFQSPAEALEHARIHGCDVAFLDVDAGGCSGMHLADRLKARWAKVNIILVTGSDAYYKEAIRLRASGCVAAPLTAAQVREELENLRYPLPDKKRMRIQTFGNFEVYVDGAPLKFKYNKAKELLAYLVDRNGALCSLGEITTVLFEDDDGHENYVKSIRKNLLDTLNDHRLGHVISHPHGMLGLVTEHVDCDYYAWSQGQLDERAFTGQYMAQYSWAEVTGAYLQSKIYHKLPNRGGLNKKRKKSVFM